MKTRLKFWLIAATGIGIASTLAILYTTNSSGSQGAGALSVINTIGLVTVGLGIVAAGAILRRSSRS